MEKLNTEDGQLFIKVRFVLLLASPPVPSSCSRGDQDIFEPAKLLQMLTLRSFLEPRQLRANP